MPLSAPVLRVREIQLRSLPMETRFPFQYGIASMTALPHVFLEARMTVDGRDEVGVSSEGLAPKWFTKNPRTTFEEDLPHMLAVIRHAAVLVSGERLQGTYFEIWRALERAQSAWAKSSPDRYPPLLANLGVSLVEKALADGLCRATGIPFSQAIRQNTLGIHLGEVCPELSGFSPADLLPAQSLPQVLARHTIGLGDPLTDAEIAAPLADGLPHSLESCIRAYGLSRFKVKISGRLERDLPRLQELRALLDRLAPPDYRLTLDGNEQFYDLPAFREHWETWRADPAIRGLLDRLYFVEQPLHRDHALDDGLAGALRNWPEAPPLIIDESDAALGCLPRALALGYSGVSHKNCKGLVKGIANACLLEQLRRRLPGRELFLSGEDLANVGPVALLQDLAVMAALGIPHVERNGHHYFRGLSMYPRDIQDSLLAHHADLYRRHEAGFPTLRIEQGQIALTSVNAAPFGLQPRFPADRFSPLPD